MSKRLKDNEKKGGGMLMSKRLKDNEKEFKGDLGECWREYVDEYEKISLDYNLTPPEKLQ